MPNFRVICPKCSEQIEFVISLALSESDYTDTTEVITRLMQMPLRDYEDGWSTRAQNAFHQLGVETFGDLCRLMEIELMRTPNCGRRTTNEIKHALATKGLTFKSYNRSPPHDDPL